MPAWSSIEGASDPDWTTIARLRIDRRGLDVLVDEKRLNGPLVVAGVERLRMLGPEP